MAATPAFPGLPATPVAKTLTSENTNAFVSVYEAPAAASGGNGVLVGRLRACSDDTAVVNLQFARRISAEDYVIGEVQVPAGAGTNGTTGWIDVQAVLTLGKTLTLSPGEALLVRAKANMTANKKLHLTGEAAPL